MYTEEAPPPDYHVIWIINDFRSRKTEKYETRYGRFPIYGVKEYDKKAYEPLKYYFIKEVGGWGQKMAIFADLQYSTIYADIVGWVGLKSQKPADVILEWPLSNIWN